MTPSGKMDLRRHKSVYTDERRTEIATAVRQWYFALKKPRNRKAQDLAGTSVQSITRWRDSGSLKPKYMAKLWELTDNPAFLLSEAERALSQRRSYEIPENVPTQEQWAAIHGPEPPSRSLITDIVLAEGEEPSAADFPENVVVKMVTASVAIITGGLIQMEGVLSVHGTKLVSKQVRQRAGALIFRLISALEMKPSDFEHVPMAETDPDVLASWAKVLASLSENPE